MAIMELRKTRSVIDPIRPNQFVVKSNINSGLGRWFHRQQKDGPVANEILVPHFQEITPLPLPFKFQKPEHLIRQNLSTYSRKMTDTYDADSEDEMLVDQKYFGQISETEFEQKVEMLRVENPCSYIRACLILNCPNWQEIYEHWRLKIKPTMQVLHCNGDLDQCCQIW